MRKAAVVVEPRRLPQMVHVLSNHMKHLGDDWDFYICCSEATYNDYYSKLFPTLKHLPGFVTTDNLTNKEYNTLLVKYEFWDAISSICDKCLIFQYDTWLLHGNLDEFLKYDYVGAPWWDRWEGGNGGLSIRTPEVMKRIIQKWNPDIFIAKSSRRVNNVITTPVFLEDADYFCNLVNFEGEMAPREVNTKFAMEHVGGTSVAGIHQVHLTNKDQVKDVLASETKTSQLEFIYNNLIETPSDINEHLPILKAYASQCDHITEMGVRWFVSTYAFCLGRPQVLKSYDINYAEGQYIEFLRILGESGIETKFDYVIGDVLKSEIEETDFLFIDTLHQYTQLKQELAIHASKARKFIGFHDTTTYGFEPEPADWQTDNIMENYVHNDKGIWPAIEEFLNEDPNWVLDMKLNNCNGLTILKRIN